MKITRMGGAILKIVCLTLLFANVYAQDEDKFKDVEIKAIKVTDEIYMLEGRGGNIGIFMGDDGVFMIDDQFAPLTTKIKAAIARLSDKPIRFLINTHWHWDHTGGNENLGEEGVAIVAHDNVYQRMNRENVSNFFKQTIPRSPLKALPVITFNDSVTFHLNGQDVKALHVSHAHTDGDTFLHFKDANVVHTGDIFFHGMYPFIDVESGGSVNGVIQGVRQILALTNNETKIIPGHGPLADKKGLQAYLDMLVATRDRVQKLIDSGKSLDEIKALKPNADYDATLGQGFIKPAQYLEILYASLSER